jgi:hypothetical protein
MIFCNEIKTKEQGQHLIIKKKLTSITYFITTIQIINKKSHKEQKKKEV